MADEHKLTPEWQALNRIWKLIPQTSRNSAMDDFRVLTDMIKRNFSPEPQKREEILTSNENYLVGMSNMTKQIVIKRIIQDGVNLYDAVMEHIEETKASDSFAIEQWLKSEYSVDASLGELIDACLSRSRSMGVI